MAAALCCGGCKWPGPQSGPDTPASSPAQPARTEFETVFPQASGPARQPVRALQTEMRIWRFGLPAESVAQAAALWSNVDETALAEEAAHRLRLNGLRVAVGRMTVWPTVLAVLEAAGAQVSTNELEIQNAAVVSIAMEKLADSRALFFYREDGGLSGARLGPGAVELQILPTFDLSVMGRVALRVTPSLHPEGEDQGWQRDHAAAQTPALRELAFTVTLEPDQFLVIGPSGSSRTPHLAGSLLISSEHDGDSHENIFCIAPRIIGTDTRPKAPVESEAAAGSGL